MADLAGSVVVMLWVQRSTFASDEVVATIVAFLKSLTGEIPDVYIAQPAMER